MAGVGTLLLGLACASPAPIEGDSNDDGSTASTSAQSGPDGDSAATSEGDPSGAGSSTSTPGGSSEDGGSSETGSGTPQCPGLPGDPGLTSHSIDVGSATRDFMLYIPEALDPEQGVPLVFVHHGASMSGDAMYSLTGFADLADAEGFVVAFPDGTTALAPWSVGAGVCPPGNLANGMGDDFAFLDAMIDAIGASHCIDTDRVFVTGFSMGGYFSNHVACANSDRVRAVAPHSGGTYAGICSNGPVPVLLLHGTNDGLIDLDCGLEARDLWVERNGCSTQFDIVPVMGGGCQWHRDCPPGGQVTLCNFDGMGHGWAGASGLNGGGTSYEDATRLVWEFFAEQ